MIRFSPSEAADYRQALRALAAVLLLLQLLLFALPFARAQQPSFNAEAEERVLALTNEFRAQNKLQPLQAESRLADAARYFAGYLASTGKLEHDADGTTPVDRVKKRGYVHCIVAENLGMEYSSGGFTPERLSRNFVEGWKQSPTHRANMLEPEITQIGVGVARAANGEYYGVQVFARPLAQMVKFRVANRTNATVRYEYRGRKVTLGPNNARNHESCVPGELNLDSSGQQVTLRPKDGGRYAVVESARGVYRIAEE
jgi:uncharacterized protein YkwD